MKMRFMLFVAPAAIFGGATSAPAQAPEASSWSQALTIDIDLSDFKFTPNLLRLHHGRAYRLHFTNSGSGGHNFSARQFFAAAQIAPDDAAAVVNGKVELAKGATRDVRLIPAAGIYKLKCTHFMHSGFGMKGSITVD